MIDMKAHLHVKGGRHKRCDGVSTNVCLWEMGLF